MSEYKRYPKTAARQIVDYNNVISKLGQKGLFCIDLGLLPIIRDFLGTRGLWHTSYSVSNDNDGYNIPDDQEFLPIERAIKLFLAEGEDMTCDILTGLTGIENAINNLQLAQAAQSCCVVGAGGSGQYAEPPTGFVDNGVDNYPDAFESRNDYNSFKCSAAYLIWQSIRQDLIFLQNTDLTAITAGVLAATLVSPIPFDEVAALALFVAQLLAEATLDTILENVIDAWEDGESDIVCNLYNASEESTALQGLETWASGILTSLEASFLGFMISSDAAKWLFSKPAILLPDYDCSSCTCGVNLIVGGTLVGNVLTSFNNNNTQAATVDFDGDLCGATVTIDSLSVVSGQPLSSANNAYRFWDTTGAVIYAGNAIPSTPIVGVRNFIIVDVVAPINVFSVNFTYTQE